MKTEDCRARFYEIRDAYLTDVGAASLAVSTDRTLLDVRSGIGETVLHWLVVEDVIHAVESLIACGAEVDTKNDFGATPLMEAASLGYEDMCRLLLTHGADVRYINERGESALRHASRSRQLPALRILLSQLQPDEPLQPYFDDLEIEMIYGTEDDVTELLKSRGLSPGPPDEL